MENLNKTEKLKAAYNALKNGNRIRFIPDNIAEHHSNGVQCWIGSTRKFIYWEDFGQSANRINLSELRWIAKVIGGCTTYNYEILHFNWNTCKYEPCKI